MFVIFIHYSFIKPRQTRFDNINYCLIRNESNYVIAFCFILANRKSTALQSAIQRSCKDAK